MRDRTADGPGLRRNRGRRLHLQRPRDLRDGRPARRIHRPLRRRPGTEAYDPRHRDHSPQQSHLPRHHRGHADQDAEREHRDELGAARGPGLEHTRAFGRARHHRRALPGGKQRHDADDSDAATLSRPGQTGGDGDLGVERLAPALQAHLGSRRRHRHPRLRRDRLGLCLSRQCRRRRHHFRARHLRLGTRSVDPLAIPRHAEIRHRQVVPRADRRDGEHELRARGMWIRSNGATVSL